MNWSINLIKRTAYKGNLGVRFKPEPSGNVFDAYCARDPEGSIWRGSFIPGTGYIANETERLHALISAVDAYSKALRDVIDPFPQE